MTLAVDARRSAAAALFAVAFAVTGPAFAQQDSRWESFKDDAGGLFGTLFGGSERGGSERAGRARQEERPTEVAQMSATDLMVRLDRLENQVRQLTGTVEQLQFRNQQLEQQLRRAQEDTDFRMQERGGAAARPRTPPPPGQAAPTAPAAPPTTGRRSDVFDPNENPSAPGAPRTLGGTPASPGGPPPIIADEPPVGAPGGRQAGAPLDLSTLSDRVANDPDPEPGMPPPRVAAAPSSEPRNIPGPLPPPPPRNPNATGGQQQLTMAPSATPKDELALAQGYIQRKDYALAENSLREFLKKYPSDRLVSDAHYWLGESLFQRQRYRDAAESFLTVSTKFESSGRAPEALLRLGQSLAALGEREAACATLGEVNRKYPRAGNNVKQGVEREQKRARC
jgi:tol-pal system protein YbgF